MSGNLIDLRRRIKSVKNTQKITRAMKTVSAAKLRKSTQELQRSQPFMTQVERLLNKAGQELKTEQFPFLAKREEGKHVLVVISSDKGLCGAFNSHVIRKSEEYFNEIKNQGSTPVLITVGNRINKYFLKKQDCVIKKSFTDLMSRLSYDHSLEFSAYLQDIFLNEDIKVIEFVYTAYISASRQQIKIDQVFPLKREWEKGEVEKEAEAEEIEYIFEPKVEDIFTFLLPKYLNALLYRLLRSSEASEHAARMIAMDLATRNAEDMIRSLTLVMNKVRQASITKELLEIITATEALKI
jgi:F-type H+-transporting ATPase subunit gamma